MPMNKWSHFFIGTYRIHSLSKKNQQDYTKTKKNLQISDYKILRTPLDMMNYMKNQLSPHSSDFLWSAEQGKWRVSLRKIFLKSGNILK